MSEPQRASDPVLEATPEPLFDAASEARIVELLRRYPTKRAALLPVLHLAQRRCGGWLPDRAIEQVIAKITDADEVAKARLFPYQVWAAYANAPSDNWKRALGRTLELTVGNIPALDGTLVLIDTSGSMQSPVAGRSTMQRVEVAAVMAMATAKRASHVDVVIFGQTNAVVRKLFGFVPRGRRSLVRT